MEKKLILILVISPILLVLTVFALAFIQRDKSSKTLQKPEPLKIGSLAPDFTFPDLNDSERKLSDYRGKVVFINIWATWCPPCIYEMPSMQRLYDQLKGEDFEILAISIDALGKQVVEPFIQKYHLTFPVLLDPTGKIKKLYATTGVPESFIVDKNGILVLKVIGPQEWDSEDALKFFRRLIQGERS
ncbi:MAG TPA: TlpA disulfide reductase family protein [Candidatus Limnocylindrales bacterium]|nr:TlpA disulfide reductase family protein [Candidatus Limnocylindrales bacterium]